MITPNFLLQAFVNISLNLQNEEFKSWQRMSQKVCTYFIKSLFDQSAFERPTILVHELLNNLSLQGSLKF